MRMIYRTLLYLLMLTLCWQPVCAMSPAMFAAGLRPETVAYKARVEADGGIVPSVRAVDQAVRAVYANGGWSNLADAWGYGWKKDGSNNISVLYGLKGNDLVQPTALNQPTYDVTNGVISTSFNGANSQYLIQNMTQYTSQVVRASYDATTAMVWLPNQAINAFTSASTPRAYIVRLYNGSKYAWAYVGEEGAGSGTEGNPIFLNPDFSIDSNWTKGSGWGIGSNVATHSAGSSGSITQNVATVGQLLHFSVDINSISGAGLYINTGVAVGSGYTTTGTKSDYGTATATTVGFYAQATAVATIDNGQATPVTVPPAVYGAKVYTTKTGSTRGWNVESGFNWAAATYTVQFIRADFNGLSNLTVMSYANGAAQTTKYVVSKSDGTGNMRSFYLCTPDAGDLDRIQAAVGADGGQTNIKYYKGSQVAFDSSWHLSGFSFGNDALALNVDGTADASPTKTTDGSVTSIYDSYVRLIVGAANLTPSGFFSGKIGPTFIFYDAKTTAQTTNLYNATKAHVGK